VSFRPFFPSSFEFSRPSSGLFSVHGAAMLSAAAGDDVAAEEEQAAAVLVIQAALSAKGTASGDALVRALLAQSACPGRLGAVRAAVACGGEAAVAAAADAAVAMLRAGDHGDGLERLLVDVLRSSGAAVAARVMAACSETAQHQLAQLAAPCGAGRSRPGPRRIEPPTQNLGSLQTVVQVLERTRHMPGADDSIAAAAAALAEASTRQPHLHLHPPILALIQLVSGSRQAAAKVF
jgi:hypothetical protein